MVRKTIQILTLIFFTRTFSFSQNCDEFILHLKSIDTTFQSLVKIKNEKTSYNRDLSFLDFTIKNLLNKPSDSCFISNRKLLRKFETNYCDSNLFIVKDKFSTGEKLSITIQVEKFNPDNHEIIYSEDSTDLKKIDNQFPFGGQYVIPEITIKSLEIKIDNFQIEMPYHVYKNLFEPNLCNYYGFMRGVEAYESLDEQFLYLYIYGGNAAAVYFTKLIFNKEEYITKIISDYYPLSINSAFRKDFIGF